MNPIIRPTKSTRSSCSGQQMTVEGCTWLTATANNVSIRAKFLVAKGITEQVLLSCCCIPVWDQLCSCHSCTLRGLCYAFSIPQYKKPVLFTGGLINPRPWRGRCRAGFSNTGGPPLPQKRTPPSKKAVLYYNSIRAFV